jgi:pantoate--beta-alanine ligase
MHIFTDTLALQAFLESSRKLGKTWGFVPTMGALHQGHISLVQRSNQENDFTVCSIYVNPTQFNNPEDLKKYPRTLDADYKILEQAGCEVLFTPADAQVYPKPSLMTLNFGNLEQVMEGKFRPGHFNGVGIVVAKLLHLVQPAIAYFGQKDLQQFLIVNQMVRDLSFPIKLVRCPIVREADGLAMSSRNQRLTPQQRAIAPALYQSLEMAQNLLQRNISVEEVKKAVQQQLENREGIRLEYFEVVDADNLQNVAHLHLHTSVALCIAAFVGDIRLIDNVIL